MKALSVKQPWANLILIRKKTIELRSWRTNYRGPLLICAGSRLDPRGSAFESGPVGRAIALVELVDVRPAVARDESAACFSPAAFGPKTFAWILSSVRLVDGLPIKGQLGLFTPPANVLRRLAA